MDSSLLISVISALVKYYHYQTLYVCVKEGSDEIEQEFVTRNGIFSNVYTSFVNESNPQDANVVLADENDNAMVFCALEKNLSASFKEVLQNTSAKIRWVVSEEDTQDTFSNLTLRLDSQILLIKVLENSRVILKELYQVNQRTIVNEIGVFHATKGLRIKRQNLWDRRNDLMRAHLINSVMPFQPYLMFENGSIAKQSGFCYDILVSMAQALNFTYTTVMPEDRGWGYRASNSTEFNGIIGMLQRKEADMSFTSVTITSDRSEVASYANAYRDEPVTMTRLKGGRTNNNTSAYTEILTPLAWLVSISMILLFLFMVTLTSRRISIDNTQMILLSILQRGDYEQVPLKKISMKIVNLQLFIPVIIKALLNRNYQDIYENSIPVFVLKDSSNHRLLASAESGSFKQKVFNQLEKQDNFVNDVRELDEVYDKHPSALYLGIVSSAFSLQSPSRFENLEKSFDGTLQGQLAMAMQKDSEYLKLFNHQLGKMQESGLMQKLEDKWFGAVSTIEGKSNFFDFGTDEQVPPLGFGEVFFLVLMLASVAAVAILLLLLEFCCKRFFTSSQNMRHFPDSIYGTSVVK